MNSNDDSSNENKINKIEKNKNLSDYINNTSENNLNNQENSDSSRSSENPNKNNLHSSIKNKKDLINTSNINEQRINKNSNLKNRCSLNTNKNNFIRKSVTLKKMKVNDDTDNDNLLDDYSEEKILNCRQKLDKFLSTNNRLFYLQITIDILAALTYIFYVLCTYKIHLFRYLNYIDYFACLCFILEHSEKIILSHHSFTYLISIESIIDLLTEIPPFFTGLADNYDLSNFYRFINITRVLRLLRVYRIMDLFQTGDKNVSRQIIQIIIIVVVILLLMGGILQMLEKKEINLELKLAFDEFERDQLFMQKDYHHYIYCIIVTLTTVGYGDMRPKTILGKGLIMVLVVVILVVVPDQTNQLIDLVSTQSYYATRKYISSNDIFHIILVGEINLESLKSFCTEFFHQDHGGGYRHAVIIRNEAPSKEMENFLNNNENSNFLIYIQGDPRNEEDLLRADILNAKACIVFTNKNSKDPYSGDHQSLSLSLFIKKFYFNHLIESVQNEKVEYKGHQHFRLCIQLNKPESVIHYYNSLQSVYKKKMTNDQLLVIEGVKMNLLSKSCLTPGIIALLSNLLMSSGILDEENQSEWLKEYVEGRGHEIYKVNLSGYLLLKSFSEIAIEIYDLYHAIPIALEIYYNGNSLVKLNPQCKEPIIDILKKGYENDVNSTNATNNNNEEKIKHEPKAAIYIICSEKSITDEIMLKENKTSKMASSNKQSKINVVNFPINYNNKNGDSQILKLKQNYNRRHTISHSENSFSDEEEGCSIDKLINGDNINAINDENNCLLEEDENFEGYHTIQQRDEEISNYDEIILQSLKDREDIKNHVIICGMHPEIIHLILPLRAKYLPEKDLKWIVILSPSFPSEIHQSLLIFPKIIFLLGNPLQPESLLRANILSADIAVILSSGFTKMNNNEQKNDINCSNNSNSNKNLKEFPIDQEETLDAETIFIYKAIKKLNKDIKIMAELLVTKNIEFLLTARNLKKLFSNNNDSNNRPNNANNNDNYSSAPKYEHTSVFASGEVFLPSVIDKMTCQTFYNPNLLNILELILSGESNQSKAFKKLDKLFNIEGSNLFMIPNESKNESYYDMFVRLVTKCNVVPIALYRKNILENFYYVYTHPKKTTLIRDTDFVFILSSTEQMIQITEKIKYNDSINHFLNFNTLNSMGNINNNNQHKTNAISITNADNNILGSIINSSQKENINDASPRSNISEFDANKSINHEPSISNKSLLKSKQLDHQTTFQITHYSSINELQQRLNNALDKLNLIKEKCNNIPKDINAFISEELNSELSMYLSKSE